jgi:proline dehydrogenase
MATLDLLGEEVSERSRRPPPPADEYVRMLDAIAARGLPANVSIKLTSLGLKIDPDFCRDQRRAHRRQGGRRTRELRAHRHGGPHHHRPPRSRSTASSSPATRIVGVVFQAYMRRTLADIAALPADRRQRPVLQGDLHRASER